MALAEARAAWQRTANRCLVQEDAKRAPKLACCSSMASSVTQAETGPTSAASGQDIPSAGTLPFNQNPSYTNLSPSSKWWLQMPPSYGYQKGMIDGQCTSPESDSRTCKIQETPGDLKRNGDDSWIMDQISHFESPFDNQGGNLVSCEKKDFSVKGEKFEAFCNLSWQDHQKFNAKEDFGELRDECFLSEVSKYSSDLYFDSESSWIGGVKNTPWWRTADAEELALIVAQRSLDLIENCDLPSPRNTHSKKDPSINMRSPTHEKIYSSSYDQKPITGHPPDLRTYDFKPGGSLSAENSCRKLRMSVGDQSLSGTEKASRHSTTHKRIAEIQAVEGDAGKAQLLEALRHSQTRAREAEQVAKKACAEKEHIIKLVFRQASQLFAYKQWIQLLQLENMYIQYKNSQSNMTSTVSPVTTPSKPARTRKVQKNWDKSWGRKGAKPDKQHRSRYDVGKFGVVFAVGLGLIGAGLLLGWTIGWILPTWG